MTLLEFAKSYMITKLNTSVWDAMQDPERTKWLSEATRCVLSIDGISLPEVYDDNINTAICEVCLEMMSKKDLNEFDELQRVGVTSISYGNDTVSFNKATSKAMTNVSCVNDYAFSLLRPYIQRSFDIV